MLFCEKNRKGFALIVVYTLLIFIILILGVFYYTSIQSEKVRHQRQGFIKAFYTAESGIDIGLGRLPMRFDPLPDGDPNPPLRGFLGTPSVSEYRVTINPFPVGATSPYGKWRINSIGLVPDRNTLPRTEVELEVVASFVVSTGNFFDNALYSATDLTIRGGAYEIDGDVYYNEDGAFNVQHPGNITGSIDSGETLNFVDDIDWNLLLYSAGQQEIDPSNTHIHVTDVDNFNDHARQGLLPQEFWFDAAQTTPNIIYVQGSGPLRQSGNIALGGLIIFESRDFRIGGTMTIDGCMLVRGDLTIVGTVDVTGGVWAGGAIEDEAWVGDGATVVGDVYIAYDQDFMSAVEGVDFLGVGLPNVFSWREIRREIQ